MTEPDHERAINAAMTEYMASAGKPETERVRLWVAVVDLIAGRTPRRVREMEQGKEA